MQITISRHLAISSLDVGLFIWVMDLSLQQVSRVVQTDHQAGVDVGAWRHVPSK